MPPLAFLIDEDLPRSLARTLRLRGFAADDVRDIGLHSTPDHIIAALCKERRLCLVTGDFGFADMRRYPPADFGGIIVVWSPNYFSASAVVRMTIDLLSRTETLERIAGRLVIVEPGRTRMIPR